MPSYNVNEYSWCDLSIAALGRIYEGVTGVEWSRKKDLGKLRGRGCKTHKITEGNEDFEGKIKLWQSEVIAMENDAPSKDITKIPFDLTIAFTPEDGEPYIATLIGCRISEDKRSMNQGDKNMEIELPFVFLELKRQD